MSRFVSTWLSTMLQFVMTMGLLGGGLIIAVGVAVIPIDRNDQTEARP